VYTHTHTHIVTSGRTLVAENEHCDGVIWQSSCCCRCYVYCVRVYGIWNTRVVYISIFTMWTILSNTVFQSGGDLRRGGSTCLFRTTTNTCINNTYARGERWSRKWLFFFPRSDIAKAVRLVYVDPIYFGSANIRNDGIQPSWWRGLKNAIRRDVIRTTFLCVLKTKIGF